VVINIILSKKVRSWALALSGVGRFHSQEATG